MAVKLKVTDLNDAVRNVTITLTIREKQADRTVTVRKDNSEHRVATFVAEDETGTFLLNLWDADIDRVAVGARVEVTGGYVRGFRDQLYLNVGQFGALKVLPKQEVGQENRERPPTTPVMVCEILEQRFNLDLTVRVTEISEVRTVTVKKDGSQHQLQDYLVGDDTGCIVLTLWDENMARISGYFTYRLKGAYLSKFNGGYRLNLARKGTIERVETDVTVNLFNNLSLLDA